MKKKVTSWLNRATNSVLERTLYLEGAEPVCIRNISTSYRELHIGFEGLVSLIEILGVHYDTEPFANGEDEKYKYLVSFMWNDVKVFSIATEEEYINSLPTMFKKEENNEKN